MKNIKYTIKVLTLNLFCVSAFSQAPTSFTISDDKNDATSFNLGVTLDTDASGPVILDNSTIALFVPAGATGASYTDAQGGNWGTQSFIPNSTLSGVCPTAGVEYALLVVQTNGQANLGDVTNGVLEDLAAITLTGSPDPETEIYAYDPSGGDALSVCVADLGINNVADIDPDGNAGAANTESYEDISVMGQFSLPIKLTRFNANKGSDNISVDLDWVSETEINASHYGVERSQDGSNWTKIGEVDAVGESSTRQAYNFTDSNLPLSTRTENKTFLYRLNMVDNDGSQEYSEVREVRFDEGNVKFAIFPNPTSSYVTIDLSSDLSEEIPATLFIYSNDGRLVKKASVSTIGQTTVEMNDLVEGSYIFTVIQGETVITKQVQKIN